MANPGPASTVTTNYPLVTNQNAQGTIVLKGLSVSAAGDTLIQLPSIVGAIVPTTVVTTNSQGVVNVAAATVGIYTLPGQQGTAVLTTAALTGQTTNAFAYVRAATAIAAQVPVNGVLYANVVTPVVGATIDLYLNFINVS